MMGDTVCLAQLKTYCSQIKVLLRHLIGRVEENNDNSQSSESM